MADSEPIDISKYRHPNHCKTKWIGPPDHPSDLGESAEAHFEYTLRPEEFFVPPADAQGRSVSIIVRMQPQLLRVLTAIRDSDNSPFATINDIVRHALHREARWYFAIHPHLKPTYWSIWKIALEATRDYNHVSATQDNFNFIKERIKRLVNNGDFTDALVETNRVKGLFEDLPESPARREVLAEIKTILTGILKTQASMGKGIKKKQHFDD